MSKKYLSGNNSAPRLPIAPTAWTMTTLKVFGAPSWLYGVFITLYALWFLVELIRIFSYEKVEL